MPDSSIAAGFIAFIGFGEAARAFLDGWRSQPGFNASVSAYDIKTDSADADVRAAKRADYAAANVIGASSAPDAVAGGVDLFGGSRLGLRRAGIAVEEQGSSGEPGQRRHRRFMRLVGGDD